MPPLSAKNAPLDSAAASDLGLVGTTPGEDEEEEKKRRERLQKMNGAGNASLAGPAGAYMDLGLT